MSELLLSLSKGLLAESATRGDKQRYSLGDPLVDEWDEDGERQQKLKKQVKEFLEVEDKIAEDELEKVIKDRKAELADEEKQDKEEGGAESPEDEGDEGGDDDLPNDDDTGGLSLEDDGGEDEGEESESSSSFTLDLEFSNVWPTISKTNIIKALNELLQAAKVGRGKVTYVSHELSPNGYPDVTLKGPRPELEQLASHYYDEANYAAVKREYGDIVKR